MADRHAAVLLGAAHEIGHVVSAVHHDIHVPCVVYDPTELTGVTTLDLPDDEAQFTAHQWRAWLVGCMAGWEAEVMWAARHGGRVSRRTCQADFANFRKDRRRIGLSQSAARYAARSIVRSSWPDVERLVPQLAREGRL